MADFYPPITANKEYTISVDSGHDLYVASYGNPNGIPVITLHGGPGSGTAPYFAQFFNPEKYHIIVADQRGAGNSTPKGQMEANTTQDLIRDMETIREMFGFKEWVVFGGSWGSTLSLLYAQAHPERVSGLILRGIFLARGADDINAFTHDGSAAALKYPAPWAAFKDNMRSLIARAGQSEQISVETHSIYHICYVLLQHADPEIRRTTAAQIATWEKRCSFLEIKEEDLEWGGSDDGVNMGLTEATYFEHNCFIEPNQILNDLPRLAGIPIHIVQGTDDLVCPSEMADVLEAALRELNGDKAEALVVRYNPHAGHSHKEPGIVSALVESSDQLAVRLEKKTLASRASQGGIFSAANAPASSASDEATQEQFVC